MKITIATCQFPVSADIHANRDHILALMQAAKAKDADVAHFCEGSLSGYAGTDFETFENFDWEFLKQATLEVMACAKDLRLWVIVGSAHPLTPPHKPHNCVYIIDDNGALVERYDKLYCAGNAEGTMGDLAHYSPGNHFSVFEIKGVRCGALICHDYRYPELYREYKQRGVQLMFHSYHAGGTPADRYKEISDYVGAENKHLMAGDTLPGITMPAGMIASASNNYVWISCPNSSAKISCWPSFFVRPDGVITGIVELHETGILLSTVDTHAALYDSTVAWRDRAITGIYHSGDVVEDARSDSRTVL